MSFYLDPPGGSISLQNLEKFAEKRLDFLIKIFLAKNDRIRLFDVVQDSVNVTDSECLIGGTKKDGISHFILRLALCSEIDTAKFLISAEIALFEFRFLCMNEDELRGLFHKAEKSITSSQRHGLLQNDSALVTLIKILKDHAKCWKEVVRLYLKGDDSNYFHVPFNYVFNLVAKRQVVLSNGMAAVPFSKVRDVITDIFKDTLTEGTKLAVARRRDVMSDIRMKKLFKKLVILLRNKLKPLSEGGHIPTDLSHDTVAIEMPMFPPCMFNLYQVLENRHRLPHHSRIQFTLFMKEIGMPVHEALMYWRKEYSVNVEHKDGCHHDWKTNEKRYIYSIRHLYGLEGSHINYKAHCCSSIQDSTPSVGDVGGCPFKHFDRDHLNVLMNDMGLSSTVKQTIDKLVTDHDYSKACREVLYNKMSACSTEYSNSSQAVKQHNFAKDCHHGYSTDLLPVTENSRILLDTNTLVQATKKAASILDQDFAEDCHHGYSPECILPERDNSLIPLLDLPKNRGDVSGLRKEESVHNIVKNFNGRACSPISGKFDIQTNRDLSSVECHKKCRHEHNSEHSNSLCCISGRSNIQESKVDLLSVECHEKYRFQHESDHWNGHSSIPCRSNNQENIQVVSCEGKIDSFYSHMVQHNDGFSLDCLQKISDFGGKYHSIVNVDGHISDCQNVLSGLENVEEQEESSDKFFVPKPMCTKADSPVSEPLTEKNCIEIKKPSDFYFYLKRL